MLKFSARLRNPVSSHNQFNYFPSATAHDEGAERIPPMRFQPHNPSKKRNRKLKFFSVRETIQLIQAPSSPVSVGLVSFTLQTLLEELEISEQLFKQLCVFPWFLV
jgi:hypothetical protein